jgi:hypothetical protein
MVNAAFRQTVILLLFSKDIAKYIADLNNVIIVYDLVTIMYMYNRF